MLRAPTAHRRSRAPSIRVGPTLTTTCLPAVASKKLKSYPIPAAPPVHPRRYSPLYVHARLVSAPAVRIPSSPRRPARSGAPVFDPVVGAQRPPPRASFGISRAHVQCCRGLRPASP